MDGRANNGPFAYNLYMRHFNLTSPRSIALAKEGDGSIIMSLGIIS